MITQEQKNFAVECFKDFLPQVATAVGGPEQIITRLTAVPGLETTEIKSLAQNDQGKWAYRVAEVLVDYYAERYGAGKLKATA